LTGHEPSAKVVEDSSGTSVLRDTEATGRAKALAPEVEVEGLESKREPPREVNPSETVVPATREPFH